MIKLHFCDFYPGFNHERNFFTSCFQHIFSNISLTDHPSSADIVLVSIFGNTHQETLSAYRHKSILWLGENIRPIKYNPKYSLSCDFYDYNGINTRLPLWFLEIDWFNNGIGLFTLNDIYQRCVLPGVFDSSSASTKKFCIAIFNNPEGLRMSALSSLETILPVTKYGKPFGNWFATYDSYAAKISRMSNFAFNLCPENSYFPGYYTEKALHAKMAQSVPIYMSDPLLKTDFRPQSLLNLYNYKSSQHFIEDVAYYFFNKSALASLLNQPLFSFMPSIKPFLSSLYRISMSILSSSACI